MLTPLRSVLFMPASNERAIAKARSLPCDAVILDLEDAVAPERKVAARGAAVAALDGFGPRTAAVRANGLDTEWGVDDLVALRGAAAVVLPKVDGPDDLARARAALGDAPALWAMIETAAGVLALPAIAGAARALGVAVLIAGTNDLAKELRCRPGVDRMPLMPVLSQIVVAARAAGAAALDGVLNALGDEERLEAECAQGAALGFDGKTLIHPGQIDAANRAFGPDTAAIDRARRIVAAYVDAPGAGAIRLDGEMVERLHLAEAERVLKTAG